ncbi:MAG: hypothetical protein GSR85_02740 [Desulfurococcales archaeon]|nr:hypothetical protein [Desulfurococcales archaeon]
MASIIRASIIGFGNVGRSLFLEAQDNPFIEVAVVSSSKGSVYIRGVREAKAIEALAREGRKLDGYEGLERVDPVEALDNAGVDVAFIAIPPNYDDGEPNISLYRSIVNRGVDIVTADKTVLALDYHGFLSYAAIRGVRVGYTATVAAGIPAIEATRALKYRGVERIEAVLNATTNYILSLMEEGLSYEEAVEKAIKTKLAEPDPRVDTHGWDPAAKLAILLSTLGRRVTIRDIERIPLEEAVDTDKIRKAMNKGLKIKYIAHADLKKEEYRVEPIELPENDPLARTHGIYNTIRYTLEGETVTLSGPVGPAWRTARVMLSEALLIAKP